MNIVALAGWLQPADTLKTLLPAAEVLDYSALPDIDAVAEALAARQPELLVGWSLGGVLAVQSVLQNPQLRPKKLVILGSPFQFIASPEIPEGATPEALATMRSHYLADPLRMANYLQGAINEGMSSDSPLCPLAPNAADTVAWLPWLEYLGKASFNERSCGVPTEQGEARSGGERSAGGLPPLKIIHGAKDAIVPVVQAKYWSRIFPQTQVLVLPKASHAPHVQAAAAVAEFINAP
jgi:pimeloyl-ACP methyl ester carboxylesterase